MKNKDTQLLEEAYAKTSLIETFISLLGRAASEKGNGFWTLEYIRKTLQDMSLQGNVQAILARDIKHLRELEDNPMHWEINKRD